MVQTRQKSGKQTDKENADSPSKDPKPSSTQSQPAATPALAYTDWASYQAYYNPAAGTNVAAPSFPPQIASSPQGHPPYMWGPQMAPYGTPYVMYPHGGVYPYPSVQPGSVQYNPYPTQSANGTTEASGKSNKSKSEKKLKGKKKSLSSSNGTSSQSGESGSDDSSEGSSSSTNKAMSSGREMSQKGSESRGRGRKKSNSSTPTSAPQQQQQMVVSPAMPPYWAIPPGGYATPGAASGMPADYWAAAAAAAAPATPITMTVKAPTPRRNLVQTDPNPQDEREQKRQKRKQSNRESARRSRLKKQAEWELVAKNAADLKQENESLKEELKRLQDECDKLNSENASLKEKVNESNHEL
ncbi:transcription factor HBP-1a-like isoform X4 [Carex littledalei]|uniref:Transcription factor HBP-1a-like isoform X4 n=1 Tax=Carex littledalei TaxID=544730 RepID=A0A833VBG4_9POAL|nr:transcription factor HBP-1a-like isoform X4 [Carex littledalei]